MDRNTFIYNFTNDPSVGRRQKTYLCYEVQLLNGNPRVPLSSIRNFLHSQLCRHAELCFLDLTSFWQLYPWHHYRVTWFLSWSPCPDCAREVAAFLWRNRHVSLSIFAARIYTYHKGYEEGLRSLRDAGVHLVIMTYREFEYCWRAFVDNQLLPFRPWNSLEENSQVISRRLQGILQDR
ncbi:DNA dC-_dU-editing enzyme APOBEC-3G-like, partial [Orycteropus afer afer]|uniref:DNA dC->dU-editing enzyme APOBEC-3G-like n=1 Tax=Orycteropus afer afer TaxID=1230840 RepID=A0AC54ZFT3_ORYAF